MRSPFVSNESIDCCDGGLTNDGDIRRKLEFWLWDQVHIVHFIVYPMDRRKGTMIAVAAAAAVKRTPKCRRAQATAWHIVIVAVDRAWYGVSGV